MQGFIGSVPGIWHQQGALSCSWRLPPPSSLGGSSGTSESIWATLLPSHSPSLRAIMELKGPQREPEEEGTWVAAAYPGPHRLSHGRKRACVCGPALLGEGASPSMVRWLQRSHRSSGCGWANCGSDDLGGQGDPGGSGGLSGSDGLGGWDDPVGSGGHGKCVCGWHQLWWFPDG